MIIVDSLEIMKLSSQLLLPLLIQSLRNELHEFPNMPRQLMQKLTNLACVYKVSKKEGYLSSLGRLLLFKLFQSLQLII